MAERGPSGMILGYEGQNAIELCAQYELLDFKLVYLPVLNLLPAHGAQIVDIGAGSGRDAAALAKRGYSVVAVEPSPDMMREARRRHTDVSIEWIVDGLPHLEKLVASERRFDFALLNAVWIHLAQPERPVAMSTLSSILKPDGRALLSLRHGAPHPDRRMFVISPHEVMEMAGNAGLNAECKGPFFDPLDRWDVTWSFVHIWKACDQAAQSSGSSGASEKNVRGQ